MYVVFIFWTNAELSIILGEVYPMISLRWVKHYCCYATWCLVAFVSLHVRCQIMLFSVPLKKLSIESESIYKFGNVLQHFGHLVPTPMSHCDSLLYSQLSSHLSALKRISCVPSRQPQRAVCANEACFPPIIWNTWHSESGRCLQKWK